VIVIEKNMNKEFISLDTVNVWFVYFITFDNVDFTKSIFKTEYDFN